MLVLTPKITQSKAKLFMKDPQSDLFILINKHIIPVHTQVLSKFSSYFQKKQKLNTTRIKMIQIITQPLEVETVILVLKYYYGFELRIPRNEKFFYFMDVLTHFEFSNLRDMLICDILKNIQVFGIFFALQFSKTYGITKLEQLCWAKLKKGNYDQVCSQKSDFLKFLKQMAAHFSLEADNRIIKDLIADYNSFMEQENICLEETLQIISQQKKKFDFQMFQIKETDESLENELKDSNNLSTQPSPFREHNSISFSDNEEFEDFIQQKQENK